MSDPHSTAERAISSFQILLPPDWHRVPLGTGQDVEGWAAQLAQQLTSEPTASASLREGFGALQARMLRSHDVTATAAVYVPWPEFGQIACALAFELTPRHVFDSAEDFQQSLNDEAAEWQPGMEFRGNRTWLREVPAGQLVGSVSLISHRDPGADMEHLEQRTVFGVFPPNASELVQFVFSSQDLNAFEDMAEQTEQLVATLEVELDSAS